jgi:signal transduction histidine kinase/HAMP domain-containing protein
MALGIQRALNLHPLMTEWWTGLKRLFAGPRSLERLLVLAIGGTVLLAIVALALGAGGLLKAQATEQALSRVRLAGLAARDEIRRHGEDTLTSARLLASRPTLQRLLRGPSFDQLPLFLRRFGDTAGLDACAVFVDGLLLTSTGRQVQWPAALEAAREQGEGFMLAGATAPGGQLGALVNVTEVPGVQVMVIRLIDERLARALSEQVGIEVRLLPLSDWLEAVEVEFRRMHSEALATGGTAVAHIAARQLYASSTPVFAATGEGVALIETQLPAAEVAGAVASFVRRLTLTTILLAALALGIALLLARRIGAPLQALAGSAERLGRGDFSASIPAEGTQEVAALAQTMDEMRRNLIELTSALRRREAEAQAVLQGVVEGVYAVDAGRRIRYLNPQAARMLGAPAADLIGKFCGDVLLPCQVDGQRPCETACPIVAARGEGKAQATERLEAGGVPRTVVITSAAPTDGLQVQVMRDETELEAVRRARDSVLANISHEFRTPLAAQLASVELMLDGLEGMPRERLGELLSSLQRGTLRLTRLIDNLLESVRIESGQLGIRHQPVALAQVVEDAEALVAGLLTQRRQVLQLDLPAGLPLVNGDMQRLTQVVTNLLANASKFGPEDSEIHVGARAEAGEVSLWVEDEGPGAADLDGTSIFERFYRSADQEPEPRGLGLGLWIVKSIVERHGGRVAAARTEAGRTRFTVTLPAGTVPP